MLLEISNNIQVDGIIPFDEWSHSDSTLVNIIQQSVKVNFVFHSKSNNNCSPLIIMIYFDTCKIILHRGQLTLKRTLNLLILFLEIHIYPVVVLS